MQAYPWDLAAPRKRPKRLRKKLAARWNWRRFPPKDFEMLPPGLLALFPDNVCGEIYAPTRKGARLSNSIEASMILRSRLRAMVRDIVGPVRVSTVFLCIDHEFSFDGGDHPPVLWETMLFLDGCASDDADDFRAMGYGDDEAKYLGQGQWRYTSREAAVEHHAKLVGMLRSGLN